MLSGSNNLLSSQTRSDDLTFLKKLMALLVHMYVMTHHTYEYMDGDGRWTVWLHSFSMKNIEMEAEIIPPYIPFTPHHLPAFRS